LGGTQGLLFFGGDFDRDLDFEKDAIFLFYLFIMLLENVLNTFF